MRIYKDYSLPTNQSSMPDHVRIDSRGAGNIVVVGYWTDSGPDDIKHCVGEVGADLTLKAWSGQAVAPKEMPLVVRADDLANVLDRDQLWALCQQAAHSVALHLNHAHAYPALAEAADELHPGLAALLRAAQERLHRL